MEIYTIALFGEAEKGEYRTAYFCNSIEQLLDSFGNPPLDSHGLDYAVQALLYRRNLIFFRVREEGFSEQDYYCGMQLLKNQDSISQIAAICMPGVGSSDILQAIKPVCSVFHSILITSESDFYDYLTTR